MQLIFLNTCQRMLFLITPFNSWLTLLTLSLLYPIISTDTKAVK